jgi:hypothetical protein
MPTLDIVWYETELATERERNRGTVEHRPEGASRPRIPPFRRRNEPPNPCKAVAIAVAMSGS